MKVDKDALVKMKVNNAVRLHSIRLIDSKALYFSAGMNPCGLLLVWILTI